MNGEVVLEAGRGLFRTTLRYGYDWAGVWFDEFDGAISTRIRTCCERRTGPKSPEVLGMSRIDLLPIWRISSYGAYHHRDISAAVNVSRRNVAVLQEDALSLWRQTCDSRRTKGRRPSNRFPIINWRMTSSKEGPVGERAMVASMQCSGQKTPSACARRLGENPGLIDVVLCCERLKKGRGPMMGARP
jgi:hypothetical protein